MKSKLVKILFLCLCILAVICGCSNNNKDSPNNLSEQESPIPPGLKKFTFQFDYKDNTALPDSNMYKADIILPDHWSGEDPTFDENGITFLGFTSLYNIDDNYEFTVYSWKDFRRIDCDFDSMIPSTGTTVNGYRYTKYKYPEDEFYVVYIDTYPGYASDFSISLDGINSTTIDKILDSIYFYK